MNDDRSDFEISKKKQKYENDIKIVPNNEIILTDLFKRTL